MTLQSLNALEEPAMPTGWLLDRWTPSLQEKSALSLDPLEGAQFIRVLSASRLISRQTELLAWLKGEVQQFLPHQVVAGAWGDLTRWKVNCEMISNLPAVRALPIAAARSTRCSSNPTRAGSAAGVRPCCSSATARYLAHCTVPCGACAR
jgi:hypothetical protein